MLRAAILLLSVSLFGCDHATKMVAHEALGGGRVVPVAAGVLELRYAPNPDTAFGLLRTIGVARSPGLLLALSGLALVALGLLWLRSRRTASRVQHVGFALVTAGALGNVVDRAVRGYVIDFIHLAHWPTFNVADVAVVVGAGLLAIGALRRPPAGASPTSSSAAP